MLFDTHCHVDVAPLDRPDAADAARRAGVSRALAIGVDESAWSNVAARRATWPGLSIALGVHPEILAERPFDAVEASLHRLADAARRLGAAAIGECGLDRRIARGVPLERQRAVLDAHVEIARALDLPLVLHVLEAHGAALAALRRHPRLPHGGVVHAWSGSPELAASWIALGFCIAIGPAVLFERARRPVESARAVPLHALVLETDAPFSWPPGATDEAGQPRRHGVPGDLGLVAAKVAALRGLAPSELARETTRTAERLFGAR